MKKDDNIHYGHECNQERMLQDDGCYSCITCACVGGNKNQENYIPEIWKKQKSHHRINVWSSKVIKKHVKHRDVSILVQDFMKVVIQLKATNLIKKSMSQNMTII